MIAVGMYASEVQAINKFSSLVTKAALTDMENYKSISSISSSLTNNYINKGISLANSVSYNYGCDESYVTDEIVSRFKSIVTSLRSSANKQISNIKSNKKNAYENYLRQLEEEKNVHDDKSPYNNYPVLFDDKSLFGIHTDFSALDIVGHTIDLINLGKRCYNYSKYGFNVSKVGNYAIVKGAHTHAATNQGIKGTRYAFKNADDYRNVFEYVDPKTAVKNAFTLKDQSGGINFGTVWNYANILLDVGIGIHENYKEGTSAQRIITDAIVDFGVSAGSIAATTYICAAIGSFIPGIGNIVGAAVGFVVGIGIKFITDGFTYYDKTGREWLKDGLGYVGDEIVGLFN